MAHLQTTKELQRQLASKSCELSAAQLDLHCWKRKSALQQLRLVSVQEDLGHQKVHIDALAAECSRRQQQCHRLQAEVQTAVAQNMQLEARLADDAVTSAEMQVRCFWPEALMTGTLPSARHQTIAVCVLVLQRASSYSL